MQSMAIRIVEAAASTARTPVGVAAVLRNTTAELGRRIADGGRRTGSTAGGVPGERPPWWLWAELARAYLTLAFTLLPRPRPVRTVTVFVAASDTLSVRPYGSAAVYRRPRGPTWPDATP